MKAEALARRLKRGDTDALGELISLYTPYIIAICTNILGTYLPEEDIEETVSDSFAAVWYSREKIRPEKLKSYLAAIARNKAKLRLRSLHYEEPLEDDFPVAECEEPEARALRRELEELAREAVDSLPEPEREIFQRHYFLYQRTDEIALQMNLNPATVRTKLARGREKLKKHLEEKGAEYEALYN